MAGKQFHLQVAEAVTAQNDRLIGSVRPLTIQMPPRWGLTEFLSIACYYKDAAPLALKRHSPQILAATTMPRRWR
jgi:hypothetical protein